MTGHIWQNCLSLLMSRRIANTKCSGLPSPPFFLGGHYSSFPMHVEDSFLDSINAMHGGLTPCAAKLWLIIHHEDYSLVNAAMADYFAREYAANLHEYPGFDYGCGFPAHHKQLFFSPEFFSAYGIRYEVVVQRPGDVFYIGPGVYHQVINIGVPFAESINLGGPLWALLSRLYHTCRCPGTKNFRVLAKPEYTYRISYSLRFLHSCPYRGCVNTFTRKADL